MLIVILYATGEIMLVVTGILQALQIDNWKENRMSRAEVTVDSLVQIARFEFNPHIHATVSFNSNMFSSLRYTGNLSEIDPWLQEELLELNELQQEYIRSVEIDVRAYQDQASYYTLKYPFHDNGHIDPHSNLSGINQLMAIQAKTKDILEKLGE